MAAEVQAEWREPRELRPAPGRATPPAAPAACTGPFTSTSMDADGYVYVPCSSGPQGWLETVRAAAAHFDHAIVGAEAQKRLECINSRRLQLKWPRSLDALPPPIRACVETLQRRVFSMCEGEWALQAFSP